MISIVIPIYNEIRYIEPLISSIIDQDFPKEEMEVLLIDGMSNDGTREIIGLYADKYSFIKLIDNVKRIAPCAMNIGIKASSGDIIFRMDAHAKYPSNYFSLLSQKLRELNADNVGGICHTLPADNSAKSKSIAYVLSSRFGMGNSYFRIGAKEIMEVDTVPFGCWYKTIFDRIGYFDEDLVRNQDDEFNGRIINKGGKIFLIPEIVVEYYARDTVKKVFKMFYQYGLYKPLVNKKLGSPASIRQFFPVAFVIGLFAGIIMSPFISLIKILFLSFSILYIFFALFSSLGCSRNVRIIILCIWTFFVVHFAYGFGYLSGLIKLAFEKKLSAEINR